MQTVSNSPGVDGSTKSEFGSRVPASDPRHHARTSCAVHDVCHRRSCTALGRAPQTTGYTRGPGCDATRRDAATTCWTGLVCTPPLRRRPRRRRGSRQSHRLRRRLAVRVRSVTRVVPVVDLFAGPGGLAEGFSACRRSDGRRRYRIALSIEKDPVAHRTLAATSVPAQVRDRIPSGVLRLPKRSGPRGARLGEAVPRAMGRRL